MVKNFIRKFLEPIHTIFVLELFIFKPEMCEKNSKVSRAAKSDIGEPSKISEVSSAYLEILRSFCYIKGIN